MICWLIENSKWQQVKGEAVKYKRKRSPKKERKKLMQRDYHGDWKIE
jgi:hypothetical protein